jgi:hypothetical protein
MQITGAQLPGRARVGLLPVLPALQAFKWTSGRFLPSRATKRKQLPKVAQRALACEWVRVVSCSMLRHDLRSETLGRETFLLIVDHWGGLRGVGGEQAICWEALIRGSGIRYVA